MVVSKKKSLKKDKGKSACICDKCGTEVEESDIICFDNTNFCQDCADDYTFVCADCGNRQWSDYSYPYGDNLICQSCYDYNYATCDDCGRVIHNEDIYRPDDSDDEEYCINCFEKHRHKNINEYGYKPNPIFYVEQNSKHYSYPQGFLMIGVENEIDEGGKSDENARKLLEIANEKADHLYIKHDGSLNSGFELVSHPMSLAYHSTVMPWKKIMSRAIKLGYKSHDCNTCGLHLHISKAALGATPIEQDDVIARIVFFIEQFWSQLLKFSRRTEDQINRWAARYGAKENPKETLKHAKNSYTRHVCLNLQNAATIEFRIFRGTLKYETFIAALQMVETICNVAISMSDEDLQNMTWNGFVKGIDRKSKPELIKYLKTRELLKISEAVN